MEINYTPDVILYQQLDKVTRKSISYHRADSRLAPGQLEMSLQSNAVSHWMGANLE